MTSSRTQKACASCGCDISSRHRMTRFCFACAANRLKAKDLVAAHAAVAAAVKRGDLANPKTLACVDCGKPAMDYDHRDYTKPLEVEPVCRSCNKLRGPGIRGSVSVEEMVEQRVPCAPAVDAATEEVSHG